MEYKIDDLLHNNTFISHLFLECVSEPVNEGEDLIKSITNKPNYSIEDKVDIQLTINGVEVKIDPFLDNLERNFYRLVDEKAQEKFNEIFPEINMDLIQEMTEKVESVVDEYRNQICEKMFNKS